ncbi:MAG: hypothetical protein NTZ19_07005 [Bacteroidetes bacterium]|nr:hypothetical protein [Bacteroidota bacterium]
MKLLTLQFLALVFSMALHAQAAVRLKSFNLDKNIAIQGYENTNLNTVVGALTPWDFQEKKLRSTQVHSKF